MSDHPISAAAQQTGTPGLPPDFEAIFNEHRQLVYRAAYRVTGTVEDAEDVLQTLFLRLLRRECPPELADNVKAYLHRAAVNISLDIVRQRGRTQAADPANLRVEDPRSRPDRSQSSTEIQEWVRRALAEMSPKAAEIFVLRHVEGYDNTEIADMIGTSRGTVAVLLFRTRARLKKALRQHLGGHR